MSYAQHSAARSQFNDPADFSEASYQHHPVEDLEPLDATTSEYRECAVRMLRVLDIVDWFMCRREQGPPREWHAVSLALGLSSTRGLTETEVARHWGVSRQCISKDVTVILRVTGLPPAFGLKSQSARIHYQETNGHREQQQANAQSDA